MQKWGTRWYYFIEETELPTTISPGPYSIIQGRLHTVRRVYSDNNYGFVRATWHAHKCHDHFLELNVSGQRYRSIGIVVPSRIHTLSSKLPLNGIRIAVKDIFDLRGLRTSLGSHPYYQLYPPRPQTAEAVTRLISLGVDVVGKLAMSSFALMEHPMQSVDYQAPINPRGDRYQIPGGSSSGGGAAIASYEWLDLALVTDTTGSVRIPALYNGCFGLRPSSGLISMSGSKEVYPNFDTPGFLVRDLSLLHRVLGAWNDLKTEPSCSSFQRPFRVFYPRDFRHIPSPDQSRLLHEFAENLASVLSTHVEHISISEDWALNPPEGNESLDTFLHDVNTHGFYHAAYRSFEEFRSDYIEKYGEPPFLTEIVRWIWELGKEVQPHQHHEALRRIKVFRTWFLQKYMSSTENVLFILPIAKVTPNYRDIYPGIPTAPSTGLSVTSLSPSICAPELTAPIGEISYFSRITRKAEKLPVLAGLMGMPGADMEVVQVARHVLERLRLPTKIHVGRSMFGERDGSS